MKVSEIQAGKGVEGRFLAAQVERRTASNGRDYLRTVLRDKGGDSIVALQFDAPDSVFDAVTPGTTVEVRGEAEEYRGSTNLKIASIEPAAEQWDASELLPKSVKSEADMTATLHEYVGRIEDPAIRTVVERVLSYPDVGDRLGRWPAAMRRHHAQIGGLLEHILELLLITDAVVELYPSVSKDLVYAGCILHDIGKVAELGIEGQIDYTPVGLMVGHVVLGAEMVSRACAETECPDDTTLRLRNIVLSHHGTLEWGSPVLPKTPEAVAVHNIDMLSSQLRQAVDATEKSSPRAPGDPMGQWNRSWGRNWFLGSDGNDAVPSDGESEF